MYTCRINLEKLTLVARWLPAVCQELEELYYVSRCLRWTFVEIEARNEVSYLITYKNYVVQEACKNDKAFVSETRRGRIPGENAAGRQGVFLFFSGRKTKIERNVELYQERMERKEY